MSQEIHNHGGLLGANIADFLIQLLGVSSWIVPFLIGLLLYWVAVTPRPDETKVAKRRIGRKIIVFPLLIIAQAAFVGTLFVVDPMYPAEVDAGGVMGAFFSDYSNTYLGYAGTLLLHGFIMVVSLFVLLNLSLQKINLWFNKLWQEVQQHFWRFVLRIRSRKNSEQENFDQNHWQLNQIARSLELQQNGEEELHKSSYREDEGHARK
ncbi:DNA segregation ATPase FtsK/SpoIIIE-like protein [Desulfurispira natronophila]|uniref:DNA segregation ATPase FtsK/SpoIIIE-like protein n=1 Tax=Desulfurispira natronophila TaxID=682562 RepID=A0A7W7Y2N7_9BACT|nr:DNA segregation ATPase FtsK/SpoIIIE-like protein [Desulfurispira natronophila]